MEENSTHQTRTESSTTTVTKVKKNKVPTIFKDKRFIFSFSVILFLLSFFVLLLIDSDNSIRPKQLDIPFFLNLLSYFGLGKFDVQMTTWFIFFLMFGTFWVIFFLCLFKKFALDRKYDKCWRKHHREPNKKELTLFYILFFGIPAILFGIGLAGVLVYFNKTGFLNVVITQLNTDTGGQMLKFLETLAILIVLLLIVPVALLVVYFVLRLVILLISFIAAGVSNSIMQSEEYQKNVAASEAAAQDIADTMREARGRAGDALAAAKEAQRNGSRAMAPQADILFPALTTIDKKWAEQEAKEAEEKAAHEAEVAKLKEEAAARGEEYVEPTPVAETDPNARGPFDYEQFKVLAWEFQSYLCHEKFYFKINVIRSFIAGLAAARLLLLEGLSGTGKSTLPRVFLEYIGGKAYFFPVQATWRDRSDITGYYSDFTGEFKETELLKHLYEASYTPETVNLMVLDEMNISRVEYYFADFLSIFEYPAEDWLVPLLQVKPGTVLPKYIEKGMARIPTNTWFVGTINIDDSTFTITDKVYDRSIVIDFKELNLPFESSYRFDKHPLRLQELVNMFDECKRRPENNLNASERKKFLSLCSFVGETFDIQFGNRIMNQVDNFLPVFVGLGGKKEEALDIMFARKILRKLDGKFESYIKDGLNKLTRYINTAYGKHVFVETEELIERFRRKLS